MSDGKPTLFGQKEVLQGSESAGREADLLNEAILAGWSGSVPFPETKVTEPGDGSSSVDGGVLYGLIAMFSQE